MKYTKFLLKKFRNKYFPEPVISKPKKNISKSKPSDEGINMGSLVISGIVGIITLIIGINVFTSVTSSLNTEVFGPVEPFVLLVPLVMVGAILISIITSLSVAR